MPFRPRGVGRDRSARQRLRAGVQRVPPRALDAVGDHFSLVHHGDGAPPIGLVAHGVEGKRRFEVRQAGGQVVRLDRRYPHIHVIVDVLRPRGMGGRQQQSNGEGEERFGH